MRAITCGFDTVTLESLRNLEGHYPFEIAQNLRNKIMIGDDFSKIKNWLTPLHASTRDGTEPQLRVILDVILSIPISRYQLDKEICDIVLENDMGEVLTGEAFDKIYEEVFKPVIQGSKRQEVFDTRIGRLLPGCKKIVLCDRYLGVQLASDGFKETGAFWLIQNLINSGVRNIQLLTSRRDGKDFVDIDKVRKRLNDLLEKVEHEVFLNMKLGFAPHDRHISFVFFKERGSQSLTLGAGAEVFRWEELKEGFSLVNLDTQTARANENIVIESKGDMIEIHKRPILKAG